ncbi:DUF4054 domain-containing protein [Robbsia andropogonis]|uniref:DUF4054 domain-containing protein n=1 Tax=Robbsia andropogonis TaxID=28092 RepID=UPI0028C50E71|nr:DUF4054 domain-containing protein [Robbsia andropogonis]
MSNMDSTDFRAQFTEFEDQTRYTDASINTWLTVAVMLVNADRFGPLTDYAVGLVAAHHLVIAFKDSAASSAGGVPGAITGPTSSKSVDKVSVSYDTGAVSLDSAGFWGMSSYGLRYLTMARTFGAGGFQV